MSTEKNTEMSVDITDGRCVLSGVLDFDTTRVALDSLRSVIEQEPKVEIDLGSISSANSAGLALLVECQALAALNNRWLPWLKKLLSTQAWV